MQLYLALNQRIRWVCAIRLFKATVSRLTKQILYKDDKTS